jgi:hypothetical protein
MQRTMRGGWHRWRLGRPGRATFDAARHPDAAGLPFDGDQLESRLVWVFGSPRTGSTWLLEQLCDPLRLDDSTALGFGLQGGSPAPIDVLPVSEFLISSHIAPAFGDPIETDKGLVPATLNNYLGDKPAYLFAHDFEEIWRPAVRRLTLVRLYAVEAAARSEGLPVATSPCVVVKEVNGSHVADVIMSLFPRSRLLFLVRDGRDVIDSRRHALQQGGWLAEGGAKLDTAEERLEWTRKASREWACGIDAAGRAYAAQAPRLRRMVRYEELIADPTATLRELFDWLELERSAKRLERTVARHSFAAIPGDRRGATQKRRSATPGLWRDNLTSDERTVTRQIMGRRLAELGYEE